MSNKSIYKKAKKAAEFISTKMKKRQPRVAVVLGSGLGGVADAIHNKIEIHYGDIPNFPIATVEGHAGRLIIGSLGGTEVLLMKGRFHFYEGYSMREITLPVRVFSLLGVQSLVLTNAAGGTSAHLVPGTLMLITDHINLMGDNPLRGRNEDKFGLRFPDMTDVYTFAYRELAKETAREIGVNLAEGVYLALRGPIYETPAEVRMMRNLGGDALGMSTVPEAIVARHCGMKVLAFSCITNYAAGMSGEEINHLEVMDVGEKTGKQLAELIVHLVPRLVKG